MIKRYVGMSSDLRTNVWELTCTNCGKKFKPRTTMYSAQWVECPKCGREAYVDYNHYAPEDVVPQAFRDMEAEESKISFQKKGEIL